MALPYDLSHQDWHTLRHVALGPEVFGVLSGAALARLSRLYLIEGFADGAMRPTMLGRRALVEGSPDLWSR